MTDTTGEIGFVADLNKLLQEAKSHKQDELLSSDDKRRWAIIYTELEKVKAYVIAYFTYSVEAE